MRSEPAEGIANDKPAYRHDGSAGMAPYNASGGQFDAAFTGVVPVDNGLRLPWCCRVGQALRQRREATSCPARSANRACSARQRRYKKAGIEPQWVTTQTRARTASSTPMTKQLLSATATMRQPGSQQAICSSICRALSTSVLYRMPRVLAHRFRGYKYRQEWQSPDLASPGNRNQQYGGQPAQPAGLDEMSMARTDRVAVDAAWPVIFAPQRRSIASSRPITTGPDGTNVSISRPRSSRAQRRQAASAEYIMIAGKSAACCKRPVARKAATTVQRCVVKIVPAAKTRMRSHVGRVKKIANGANHCPKRPSAPPLQCSYPPPERFTSSRNQQLRKSTHQPRKCGKSS